MDTHRVLVSQLPYIPVPTDRKALCVYVISWIKNPVKGSPFDRATRLFRWLPGDFLIKLLLRYRYEGILYVEASTGEEAETKVIGHVFFQKHPKTNDWRLFSIAVIEPCRGQGYASNLIQEFVLEAHRQGVNKVRIGAGGDPIVNHLYEKLVTGQMDMPFFVRRGVGGDGWVDIVR